MPGIPTPVVRLAKGTEGPKCYGSLAKAAEMNGLPYGSRRTLKKAITDSTECKGFFWRYASPEEAAEAAAAVLPAPPPPPMPPPLPPPHGGGGDTSIGEASATVAADRNADLDAILEARDGPISIAETEAVAQRLERAIFQAKPLEGRPSTPRADATFYHGTSLEAALSIQDSGFDVNRSGSFGILGPGVYVTRDRTKAVDYTHGPGGGVILHLSVRLGRCKTLHAGDNATDWQRDYDSAWAPAGTIGQLQENCIKDPRHITIEQIELCDHNAARQARYSVSTAGKLCRSAQHNSRRSGGSGGGGAVPTQEDVGDDSRHVMLPPHDTNVAAATAAAATAAVVPQGSSAPQQRWWWSIRWPRTPRWWVLGGEQNRATAVGMVWWKRLPLESIKVRFRGARHTSRLLAGVDTIALHNCAASGA
jgi:hypothetical protein